LLLCRFSFTNYKERWFMLSRGWLAYYDSADPFKRKERGRIFVKVKINRRRIYELYI
jgi:hypothetical protein